MGGYVFLVQRGTTLRGKADILVEQVGKAHAGHGTTMGTQRIGNSNGIFALPRRPHSPQRPPAAAPPCSQRAVATRQRGPPHGGAPVAGAGQALPHAVG